MAYDPLTSLLVSATSPLGHNLQFEYDSLFRMTKAIDPNGDAILSVTYDDADQSVTYTDSEGKQTLFAYIPEAKKYVRADDVGGASLTTEYILDASKVLQRINFADGTTTSFAYDKMIRAREIKTVSGTDSVTTLLRQDSAGFPRSVSVSSFINGNGETQETHYTYKSDMSLDSIVENDGKTIKYEYNRLGLVSAVGRPSGNAQSTTQTYLYDKAGQLIGTHFGDIAYATYAYNKDGQLRLIRRSNGILTIYNFSEICGRLENLQHIRDASANTVYDVTDDLFTNTDDDILVTKIIYTIDADGQLRSKLRKMFDNDGNILRSTEYDVSYDTFGRIKSETYDGGGEYAHTRWYEYDRAGNRTLMIEDGNEYVYTYNSQYQLTSIAIGSEIRCCTYDILGNLTASWIDFDGDEQFDSDEDGKRFTWNLSGQIVEATIYQDSGTTITSVQYTYDQAGSGMLLDRSVDGLSNRFHWRGYNVYLEEENSNVKYAYFNLPLIVGNHVSRFDLGDNHTLESVDDAHFYLHDEIGNVIAIADKNGAIETRFEQDVWGNDLNNTFDHSLNISQHQTEKYYDEITGLYYFGARWYDPRIGRFVSESSLAPLGEEEYAYCHNSPCKYVDPDGEAVFSGNCLLIGWALFEIGSTGWDIYEVYRTFTDPCSGAFERSLVVAGLSAGLFSFGGGYGTAGKAIVQGWHRLPGGVRIRKVGNYFIKEVDPDASMLAQWWGRGSIAAQGRGLEKLGDMAPSFLCKEGKIITRDAGTYTPGNFWNTWLEGSRRLGTPFNDIRIRNIGENGIIFDPALHPIQQGLYTGGAVAGTILVGSILYY